MITVDGELFESLEQALDFVAERGGGIVYTPAAGTMYAESLANERRNVKIEPERRSEDVTG
ncbi:MAG: hypothetical protein ACREF4_02460 [Gammaproteobacteria bacterium]